MARLTLYQQERPRYPPIGLSPYGMTRKRTLTFTPFLASQASTHLSEQVNRHAGLTFNMGSSPSPPTSYKAFLGATVYVERDSERKVMPLPAALPSTSSPRCHASSLPPVASSVSSGSFWLTCWSHSTSWLRPGAFRSTPSSSAPGNSLVSHFRFSLRQFIPISLN